MPIKSTRMQLISGLLLLLLVSACAPTPSPTPTPAPTETETPEPTNTATPTKTKTPKPSATPTETATLTPTDVPTRKPSATPDEEATEPSETTEEATSTEEILTEAPTNTPEGSGYAPTVAQVWQLDATATSKSSTEACGGEMALDFYGLVAVTPSGDALVWRRQDNINYTLGKISLNNYAGSGPSSVPDFNLSISVSFTSETSLVATHVMTSISNPECKHTYVYNGKFNWNQP